MRSLVVTGTVIAVVFLLLLSSGCVSPPKSRPVSSTSPTPASGVPIPPTPPASSTAISSVNGTVGELFSAVTPFPTNSFSVTTTSPRFPVYTPEPSSYHTLFRNTLSFTFGAYAYAYHITKPPLVITFKVKPDMVTRKRWIENRTGTKKEENITVTMISPQAWLEVTVWDRETGQPVAKEGFAKLYSTTTDNKVVVNEAGNYQVDLHGNDISVDLHIQAAEGESTSNQSAAPVRT